MLNIFFKIFCFLRNNYFLFSLNLVLKGKTKYLKYLPTKNTECCLEGFPSSANSYSYNLIKHAFPNLKISHHTHSLAAVKYSLDVNIKTIIIFRHPKDCVSSILSRRYFSKELSLLMVDRYLYQYINFYDYIIKTKKPVLLFSFNQITNEPKKFLQDCSDFLGRDLKISEFEKFDKKIKAEMEKWYLKYDTMNDGIPLPGHQRDVDRADLISAIKSNQFYPRAEIAYQALSQKTVTSK
jgi:hypothetical protein